MSKLSLYPKLTEKLRENANINTRLYNFSFTKNGNLNEIILEKRDDDEIIVLDDINRVWNVNYDDLIISKKIQIENSKVLFGSQGIAPQQSKIGIAVKQTSSFSKKTRVFSLGSFSVEDDNVDIATEIRFEPKELRSSIKLTIFLYIGEISNDIDSDEIYLSNVQGSEIGLIEESKIILEGNASSFPVIEESLENGPLWRIVNNCTDLDDNFNDNVALCINNKHADYRRLSPLDSKMFDKFLLDEITISFITILTLIAKDMGFFDRGSKNNDYQEASLGSLISYYTTAFSIQSESIQEIHEKVSVGIRS